MVAWQPGCCQWCDPRRICRRLQFSRETGPTATLETVREVFPSEMGGHVVRIIPEHRGESPGSWRQS
jgi:hypothetical protein